MEKTGSDYGALREAGMRMLEKPERPEDDIARVLHKLSVLIDLERCAATPGGHKYHPLRTGAPVRRTKATCMGQADDCGP